MRGASGYRDCACRDCFNIAIGECGALCWECYEAGCNHMGKRACAAGQDEGDEGASEGFKPRDGVGGYERGE